MRHRVRAPLNGVRVLAAVLGVMILFGVPPSAAPAQPGKPPVTALGTVERPLLAAINAFRRAHDLRPLRFSASLGRAAGAHARAMAWGGFFSHASADGTPAASRIARFYSPAGASHWAVGEILLWRAQSVTAAEALQIWLASPQHRRELMSSEFREIGVAALTASNAPGVFGGHDITILVTDFGARS